jgi:hypothetical protein
MADYKYTTVPGKLSDLFGKIREVGVPSKATRTWLTQIGFKSSNDGTMLAVLKQIGFTDTNGAPQRPWKAYRTENHRMAMASALKQGYSKLYETYPDAHSRKPEELRDFFKSAVPSAGPRVVSRVVETFRALCRLADFTQVTLVSAREQPMPVAPPAPGTVTTMGNEGSYRASGTVVNINVQLELPATDDPAVYENFFAAMKKYLFPKDEHDT